MDSFWYSKKTTLIWLVGDLVTGKLSLIISPVKSNLIAITQFCPINVYTNAYRIRVNFDQKCNWIIGIWSNLSSFCVEEFFDRLIYWKKFCYSPFTKLIQRSIEVVKLVKKVFSYFNSISFSRYPNRGSKHLLGNPVW